jgi:hypothetical protein
MSSFVDICNRALQKLGAERITSLTQDSVNARACNLAFEPVRDAELRAHPWNFAITRTTLAEDATAPEFGYTAQFTLPSDCLRLLPPDPASNITDLDWQIEGRKILTNEVSSLEIRYIKREEDSNQYDSLFTEALACALAMELCEELTQSNTKAQTVREDYKRVMREARKLNAFENISAEQQTDTWLTVRN